MDRGEQTLVSTMAQLIIFAIVTVLIVMFVGMQDSTAYFQDFYRHDLQLTSELAIAAPGNMVLRYDNLRTDLDFEYDFSKDGVVSVTAIEEKERLTKSRSFGVPTGFSVASSPMRAPLFISWVKTPDVMAVQQVASYLRSCGTNLGVEFETISIEYQEDGVSADARFLTGGVAEAMHNAYPEGVPFGDEPDIAIVVNFVVGEPEIKIEHSGNAGPYLSCLLSEQFKAQTFGFGVQETGSPAGEMGVTITVSQEPFEDESLPVPAKIVGRIIGTALVVYG